MRLVLVPRLLPVEKRGSQVKCITHVTSGEKGLAMAHTKTSELYLKKCDGKSAWLGKLESPGIDMFATGKKSFTC